MKKWLEFLSLKNLKTEISGYGYSYSLKNFFLLLFILFSLIAAAGYFYKLESRAIFAVCISALFCLPILVRSQYKYLYEQQKFSDLVLYLEGLIYSFKRNSKIYSALIDTLPTLHNAQIIEDLHYAIRQLEIGESFEVALKPLEDHYRCQRVLHLHSFLISTERMGGQYQDTLNVLLDDIHLWTQRIYKYQQDRKQLRIKLYACLIMSLVICFGSVYMAQTVTQAIFSSPIYQFVTTLLLILFVVFYTVSESKISVSWLEFDNKFNAKELNKTLNYLKNVNQSKEKKKALIISGVCAIPALYLFYIRNITMGIIVLAVSGVYYQITTSKFTKRRRRIQETIEREYPDWLRALGLQLQVNNVYVSIINTLSDAPMVLQEELNNLANAIQDNPDSIEPYQTFLKDYDLPDIKRSMKMIYSLNALGTSEAGTQINKIIEQNMILSGKADDLKNQDQITMLGMLGTVPMVLSSIKLIIDLFLILADFLILTRMG